MFEGGGLFLQNKAGCLTAYLFFFTSFCKVRVVQRPALLNPPCLGSWGSWLNVEQITILGLLFPADAGWQTTQAVQTAFNPLFIPRDCPAAHLSASLELFLLHLSAELSKHPTASSSCTKQNTASGTLKRLSPGSQALHPAKHIHAALPVAGMLYK